MKDIRIEDIDDFEDMDFHIKQKMRKNKPQNFIKEDLFTKKKLKKRSKFLRDRKNKEMEI